MLNISIYYTVHYSKGRIFVEYINYIILIILYYIILVLY